MKHLKPEAGSPKPSYMLSASNVTFAYGSTPVLRGVSMDVPDRGFLGILGPNGSGKTTMLKLLAGTRKPAAGRIVLDGQDLHRIPRAALARRMAVVPQETHLAFDYTVLEVVLMGRYPHLGAFEIEGPRDYAAARDALAATGTAAFEDRAFATLSGGEKQRVVIAAALAQIASASSDSAPLLLLDEPTAALDLAYQLEIASLLRELRKHMPLSIVLSTHDLNFAASLCTSLVLLREGLVLAAGPADEVLTAAGVRDLYGVDAEVSRHEAAGHLVVTPIRRAHASRAS
jgi:iron complex transport system ATP-binding protein